jgi:hypothetical protein
MAGTRSFPVGTTLSADRPGAGGPASVFPLPVVLAMAVAGFLCGYGTGIVSGIPGRGMATALALAGALVAAFGIGRVSGRMTGRMPWRAPEAGARGPDEDGLPPGRPADDGEVAAGGESDSHCLSGPAAPWGRAGSGIPAVALGGSSVSLPPRP